MTKTQRLHELQKKIGVLSLAAEIMAHDELTVIRLKAYIIILRAEQKQIKEEPEIHPIMQECLSVIFPGPERMN